MKELLFSVTRKDFDVQTFRSGGKGGQKQNKTESGVRIVHRESKAVGESREERSQYQNKRIAFKRLAKSGKFRIWLSKKIHETINGESLEAEVDRLLRPENLKVEGRVNNKWEVLCGA